MRYGADFAALDRERRDQPLRDILPCRTFPPLPETLPIQQSEPPRLMRDARIALETAFHRIEARFVRFVLWDLLTFYWSSSVGWAALVYHTHQDVAAHPRA